jgi:hypothetical protein
MTAVLLCTGCENFLDTQSYTKKNTGNFPVTPEDAQQMITGIYSMLYGVTEDQVTGSTGFMLAEYASDDRLGGGGTGRDGNQAIDHLMKTSENFFGGSYYEYRYRGIFRANTALETLDQVEGWESEQDLRTARAEAHFLRAYYFFDLAQIYGDIPLPLKSVPENLPRASAEETYAVIASDLQTAIESLPATQMTFPSNGHATKWAAEALLARVFLFYTGYYGKDALPLPEGGSLSKQEVTGYLDDCINNSGHDLVSDFRNLWPYSNQWTQKDYPYAVENGLHWEGDGNREEVFSIRFSTLVDWNPVVANQKPVRYSNGYCLYFGIPGHDGGKPGDSDDDYTFPFAHGWGSAPVNPQLWTQWRNDEPNDPRRVGSIIEFASELPKLDQEVFSQWQEATGYWQKKYIGIGAYEESGNLSLYSRLMTGSTYSWQLDHNQDLMLIRFADVLLMQSELKQDPAGMNRVRQRAGLSPHPAYSLDLLKKERRYELAFEGLRWFDLMRWHDAADALESQIGASIVSFGRDNRMKDFGVGYRKRYEQTGGFWPIEKPQIDLSEGVLQQTPGWNTPDAEYYGW